MRTRPVLREAENEVEAKTYMKPRPRGHKIWPRGHIGLEDLTPLTAGRAQVYNWGVVRLNQVASERRITYMAKTLLITLDLTGFLDKKNVFMS